MLTNKNFGDIVTFTRASARWRFNSGGVLVQDAANVPSLDYDPISLAARGLLVEEVRTNLVLNSGVFTAWNVQGSTLAPPSVTAPDGSLARKLVSSVTTSTVCQAYFPSVPTTAGSTYSFSSYFKAGEYTAAYLNSNLTGGYLSAVFDLLTGATKSGAGLTASMAPAGNGWWRCTVTGVAASTAAQVAVGGASNYAGANAGTGPATGSVFDGVSGLYIWGAQFEAGAFSSSYIPTTSAQATRAADSVIIADLSKIGLNPSEGTIYVEGTAPALPASVGFAHSIQLDAGSSADRLSLYLRQASGGLAVNCFAGGVQQTTGLQHPAYTPGTVFKHAVAYRADGIASCVNGAAPLTSAVGVLPSNLSKILLGWGRGANDFLNGCLRNVRYIPRRMTNAELQNLTA